MRLFFEKDELRWPTWMALSAAGVAVVYMGLAFTVTDPNPQTNIPLLLLYPLAMIAPTVILFTAGCEQADRQRWAWYFQGIAVLLGAVIPELLQIDALRRGSLAPPFKDALYLAAYGLAILGGALYLTQQAGWQGNTTRMFLDSVLIGLAMLVLLRTLLPNLVPSWPWTTNATSALYLVAMDAGILFTVAVMGARYGRSGGYLLLMTALCFLALFVADVINLLLYWKPGGKQWEFMVYPLYIIHSTCLAHGAYHSRWCPPQFDVQQIKVMSLAEWLLWTKLPRVLAFLAVAVAGFNRNQIDTSLASLTLVIVLYIVREISIAHDDRRVLRELHEARERAHKAEEQTENFLDHIIHDLAAPLHSLQTALRRLQGEESWLMRVNVHYQQLDHLVQQLRAYQKARYQRPSQSQLGPVDIVPICFATIDGIQDEAERRGIDIRLDVTEEHIVALADTLSVRRVLDNLLANAVRATPADGSITLRASSTKRMRTRIEVIDTGGGIPIDKQAHIFSPMVHLESSGTGLGLAIARELVCALGGEIGVISQEGHGSTFWLEVPVYRQTGELAVERLAGVR